jgi:hypothetical protein
VTSYPRGCVAGLAPRLSEAATDQLSFFRRPRGFRATVTAGKFFHAPGGIYKLLFAGEKWMTSSTNTDLDIAASRAGVIHHAACANNIGLVIFWMDAGFHLKEERGI